MKKKNLNLRKVRVMDEEIRVFGVCVECGSKITDELEEYYCDDEGNLLCSHECILEHFCITQMEV